MGSTSAMCCENTFTNIIYYTISVAVSTSALHLEAAHHARYCTLGFLFSFHTFHRVEDPCCYIAGWTCLQQLKSMDVIALGKLRGLSYLLQMH